MMQSQFQNKLLEKSVEGNLSYQKILLRFSKPEMTFDVDQMLKQDVYSAPQFRERSVRDQHGRLERDKIRFDEKGRAVARSMIGS